MTYYNMSGSEDGQLRSPGEDHLSGDEHDTDSLDIKPPQANISHGRDSGGPRRKEKSFKEKKHSKERKHRERGERDSRGGGSGGNISSGGEREGRRSDNKRRPERDERGDMERYHHHQQQQQHHRASGGYERELLPNNERRYLKHYERASEAGRGGAGGLNHQANNYHQHHQQHQQQQHQYHHQAQMHMQRQPRQDYYERSLNYHHGGGGEYHSHSGRHQQPYVKHGNHSSGGGVHADYGHHDGAATDALPKERRKYSNEPPQKDAESLEQDLRSRLLSKRHKYVKGSETDEQYDVREERSENERNERSFKEREKAAAKAERHKLRRQKERDVIEVLDSPDLEIHKQHKRHSKEPKVESTTEKRKTPDDPELLARREKFLAAEREKEKRKESAREELEARREMRRERVIDALSPTAVAASVTAGLHIVKRKKNDKEHEKRKRLKKSKAVESDDPENFDNEEDDYEESETEEGEHDESLSDNDSAADSEKSYNKKKSKSKNKSRDNEENDGDTDDGDEDVRLPESPLSIGELSKSPNSRKKIRKHKHSQQHSEEEEDRDRRHDSPYSQYSVSRSSSSRSRSHSGGSSHRSHHSRSLSRSTRSRSRSRSRSIGSENSRENSRSRSVSRSRSRSEERDMKSNHRKAAETDTNETSTSETPKKKVRLEGEESPICDDKGIPLPNYFPGIQGCRSVEEFQCLNRIEEGTYGVVYRAKDKRTTEIVALKRLKMEKEKEGFPITSLREINTLLKGQHPNIVTVREIVVGSNMDKIFIVMDYVEHDLKSLMETMKNRKQSFFPGEVKCLTQQLLRAVNHLHDNWILHRDLKTSNLLLSHKGILKVGDFGLAREYGSPLKKYTSLVVTLWYRAPELLLCSPEYSTPIDVWSVGCIYAEFLQMLPLFPGKSEIDELNRIFKELGTPNEKIWPGYKDLPAVKNLLSQNSQFTEYPVSQLRKHFNDKTTETGISLLQGLLTYDPKQRLSADAALKHAYFKELPLPIDPSMFPTWPAKSELGARKALASSPKPPSGGSQFKQLGHDDIIAGGAAGGKVVSGIITGNKKTVTNTGFVLNAGMDQRQLAMGPGFSLKF